MIDIMQSFNNYVNSYDMSNKKIKLKYNHSIRVMELSEKYAKKLKFTEEDVYLAKIIGLLHDIGRFEQIKVYDTFSDLQSIDHADLGVKILFDDNYIKEFYDTYENYEIIKFAIYNHNKLSIEQTDDERKLMHAKLIRDIDKLDIVYLSGYLNEEELTPNNEDISKEVIDNIKKHKQVDRKYVKNVNDKIVTNFGYVFDINNDICLDELKDNYKYYYNKININNKFNEVYNEVIKYIDERIDKNVRK